jgi:hypothetical protein
VAPPVWRGKPEMSLLFAPDAGDAMMGAGRALQGIDNSQPAMAPMGNLRLQTTCVKQGMYTVLQ